VKVSGLAATVELLDTEAADRLDVNTLAGTDAVDSAGLAAGMALGWCLRGQACDQVSTCGSKHKSTRRRASHTGPLVSANRKGAHDIAGEGAM
jgi:hypothetical protein